jgi:hypothetical protein
MFWSIATRRDFDWPSRQDKPQGPRRVSAAARLFHFLGEVEAVFGVWIIPLFLLMNAFLGRSTTMNYVSHHVNFVEPVFVVVVMAIAATRPILQVAEQTLRLLARLLYPILYKSFLFAIIFIVFNLVERVAIGLWNGRSIAESLPVIGDGSPLGIVIVGLIITTALVPFFAFRELSRVMGKGVLKTLCLKGLAVAAKQGS